MLTPKPKGINPNFKISNKEARELKLFKPIVDVPVNEWTSVTALAQSSVKYFPHCDEKTFDKYKNTFKAISKKFTNQPAIAKFAKNIADFMEYKSFEDEYCDTLEDVKLDIQLKTQEERARKRIKLIQTMKVVQVYDAEISNSNALGDDE